MNALIDPRDDVAKVMNAVEILSHGFYRIDGIERDLAKIKVLDPSKNAALATSGNDAPEELLRKVLTTDIYNRLYNRAEAKFPRLDADILGDFVNHLSQANCGEGAWQDGWSLLGEDPQTNEMVLRFDGVMFWAQKEAVRLSVDGEGCRVRAGKEHRFLNAHFYMALGDTCVDALGSQPGPLLRFFWHLTAEAAIDYIAAITKALNQVGICFRTKVLSSPHEYNRSDAGVLYIHAAQLAQAMPLVLCVYEKIASRMSASVPLFTRAIAPGLAFAEDPGNGDSFGISRSMLMADILIANAFVSREADPDRLMLDAFRAAGLLPRRPYAPEAHLEHYETLIIGALKEWSGHENRQA